MLPYVGTRIGAGKVRRIEVTQLWLQWNVRTKIVVVNEIGTDDNLSDTLTKGSDVASIQKHLEGPGIEIRTNRRSIAHELDFKVQRAKENVGDKRNPSKLERTLVAMRLGGKLRNP